MRLVPIFLLFFVCLCRGQEFTTNIKHLSTKDGLSNRFVRALLQDSKGFIWMGTLDGLNRYDGYEFKIFNFANAGLHNDGIHSLYEDPDGMIWITYLRVGQFNIFDPISGKAVDIQAYFGDSLPFAPKKILTFSKSDANNFFILTVDGKIYEYQGNKKFILRQQREAIKAFDPSFLTIIGPKRKCIQVDTILYFFDSKWQLQQKFHLPQNTCLLQLGRKDSVLLFQSIDETRIQLLSLDFNQNKLNKIPFNSKLLGKKTIDKRFFVDTEQAIIYSFDLKNAKGLVLHSAEGDRYLDGPVFKYKNSGDYWKNDINVMCLDKQGHLWLGTEDGLYLIDVHPRHFNNYMNSDSLPTHSIRGMGMDMNGNFYANSYNGTFRVNIKTGDYQKVPIPFDGFRGYSFLFPNDSSFWIGSESHGILHYFPKQDKFIQYTFQAHCSNSDLTERDACCIWSLMEDKHSNRILIGAFNGLWVLDSNANCLKPYEKYNNFNSLKNSSVYSMYQNREGLIWIGSSSGLYLMHPQKGIIDYYHQNAASEKKVPGNTILFIRENKDGALWLGTKGNGLIEFHPQKGVLAHYTTSNGLSNNTIYAIYPDREGNLWLSSNQGLMRLSIKSKQVTIYLPEQGLPHEEFNKCSYFQASDGTLFFGGLSGFCSFHPNNFLTAKIQKQLQIPFHITEFFQIDGLTGEMLDKTADLLENYEIRLQPSDKSFILKFSFLDYLNAKTIRYAYRIEGIDKDWLLIRENFIRIQGLAAGNYKLRLRAQNIYGDWAPQEKTINIIVAPPFYRTFWFLSLIIFVSICLPFGFYIVRNRSLRNIQKKLEQKIEERTRRIAADKEIIEHQSKKLHELDAAKTRFFTNVSHEFRTPLTLILGPLKAGLDEKYGPLSKALRNALLNAHRNSLQLKRLTDELMDLSKLADNKMLLEEKSVMLLVLLQRIIAPFRTQSELQQIDFSFEYLLLTDICILIDIYKLEKILHNLLSNAFKFTVRGQSVQFKVHTAHQSLLTFTISDNGSGIAEEDIPFVFDRFFQSKQPEQMPQGGTGIGLALCKELVTLMGGKISIESKLGAGSNLTVTIPLKKSEFDVNTIHFEENEIEVPLIQFQEAPENSPLLLIVDDNFDMRIFLQELLSANYRILAAQDGQEAIKLLEKHKTEISLIISDMMMPRMDGLQLLQWLKNDAHWQKIPIILLTAKTTQSYKINALRIGVDDYIAKPFDSDELELRIEYLLTHYKQRTEISEEEAFLVSEQMKSDELLSEQGQPDNLWLQQVEEKALSGLKNAPFKYSVIQLAEDMLLSERQFRRRLKQCTGFGPSEYLKEIRLQWARELIESQRYETVAEISDLIGMSTPAYFTRLYLERFGKKPSELL